MKDKTESNLWRIFSKFIRLRDADWRGYVKCISCGIMKFWKETDCGHYIAVGADRALKYNEINNNGQCRSCNLFKSGNLINYRQGLVNKYSEEVVKKLETSHWFKTTKKKLLQSEINIMYSFYKAKVLEKPYDLF